MPRICLDPGHGGRDPGAVGLLVEKGAALDIALACCERLQVYPVEVIMTRKGDIDVSLEDRVRIANEAKADIFVSVHCNAGGGEGFESYVVPHAKDARRLQAAIHEELHSWLLSTYGIVPAALAVPEPAMQMPLEELHDRGQKEKHYYVLRKTAMPAVLLECLFVDDERDAALLRDSNFRRRLGISIADGIAGRYLGLQSKGWDPQYEVDRLVERGAINTPRRVDAPVQWGELATVLNRICDKVGIY